MVFVKRMYPMKKIFFAAILLGLILHPAVSHAARVDILPRKILLEDRQRSAEITILNLGQEKSYVRLTLISYRQKEDGLYEEIETPLNPAFDPEKAVRYSPKQFTLPPGGRQKIRLALSDIANLPDGEYRFHVKAISFDEDEFSVRRQAERGSSVTLKMNVAVVIPVVVRKGQLEGGAKIENVGYLSSSQSSQGQPALTMDLVRKGAFGAMGTLKAFQTVAGEEKEIGTMSNVNIFSEVARRKVEMPLNTEPSPGPIRLVYINEFGDKGVLDEINLQR